MSPTVAVPRSGEAAAPLLGILGGMGPRATAEFYRQLVDATPASRDQEHLRVVMWADPTIPDRTAALISSGPSPLPALREGVRWLENAGATHLAMPCNTAHAYRDELQEWTRVEILNMVEATLLAAQRRVPGLQRVGLLATRGTRRASIYEDAASRLGIEVLHVTERMQQRCVDTAIWAVKSGESLQLTPELIALSVRRLVSAGAQAAIAGCTEISVALGDIETQVPVIDSTASLVEEVITRLAPKPIHEGSIDGPAKTVPVGPAAHRKHRSER